MAKVVTAMPEKRTETITIPESLVEGIAKTNVDDVVTIVLRVKIVNVGRDTWDKKKPLEARAEILSGKLGDSKVLKAIKNAKTVRELDEAADEG